MDTLMLVEKAARALDEKGKTPFNEGDIYLYIKDNFKKDIPIDELRKAIETLLVSNDQPAPMRKCLYKDKNGGYSYLYACSFGVR